MLTLLIFAVLVLRGGFRRLWMWSLFGPRYYGWNMGYGYRHMDGFNRGPMGGYGPHYGPADGCRGPRGGFGPRGHGGFGR